jgi:hypothetical protein
MGGLSSPSASGKGNDAVVALLWCLDLIDESAYTLV